MNRRTWIRQAGAAMVAPWLAGCAGRGPSEARPRPGPVPVRLTPTSEIRTVVGLRPFRPSGFVVRAERMGDKLLVHNYGHGGAGITLSWGTAEMAADLARESDERRAAVLGCGAVGLATARTLQRRGWQVTVYARDLPPATTSNVAGGLWSPTSVCDGAPSGAFAGAFRTASERAYRLFQDLPASTYGIRWRANYRFSDAEPESPYWIAQIPHLYPEMTVLGPGEHPFPWPYAQRYLTMVIEPPIYLRALMGDVRTAGGSIVVREFASREAILALPEPVVMNCTGLGARDLFGDPELMPVKGQLHVVVPQPEVDYVTLADATYMIPRDDGILLGGTFQRGVGTLDVDTEAKDRIVAAHTRFFQEMRAPA